MYCSKCGSNLQDGTQFCPKCGSKVEESILPVAEKEVKVVLDPVERIPQKEVTDSSQSFSGQGKTFGLILMLISIIGDLVAMFAIGFDAFIPITIGATVLFVIGFFMRMFCP